MTDRVRIEKALKISLGAVVSRAPPKLRRAVHYAVFPGGGRARPALCLAVARANGGGDPALADAAAAALELLHCASLVHDDLPCFDDAALRRGKPSVHHAFGEAIAVLAGDALIAGAFETLARVEARRPGNRIELVRLIAGDIGASSGIIAGQAWESEQKIDTSRYHLAKTASLFAAAAEAGAITSGGPRGEWRAVGTLLGQAYQLADDLLDRFGTAFQGGKPVRQDARLGRPSAVDGMNERQGLEQLDLLVAKAQWEVPLCRNRATVIRLIEELAKRLCPDELRLACQEAHGGKVVLG